jgi:hypothetical protein
MNTMTLTDGSVLAAQMPMNKTLGLQDGLECIAFNPHDQRFTFNVFRSGSVYLASEGENFTRCAEMDHHADMLRRPCSENITHWRVTREAFGEPVVQMVSNGQFLFRTGPIADYLILLANDGGINDPVNEEEDRIRREDAEYDRQQDRDLANTDARMRAAINTGEWT